MTQMTTVLIFSSLETNSIPLTLQKSNQIFWLNGNIKRIIKIKKKNKQTGKNKTEKKLEQFFLFVKSFLKLFLCQK